MKLDKAASVILNLPDSQSVLLLGPPGIGKTSLTRQVAAMLGTRRRDGDNEERPAPVSEVRDLCSHLPEDLLGLPFRTDQTTVYAPPSWLHRLSKPGTVGVLTLDDLGAASPAVQTAAFKLVLERRSGDCVLADEVKIIATSNRREDKSGATTLPAALRNRCCIIEIEVDADGWCLWAAQNKVHGDVEAFIRFKPGALSRLPKDADGKGAFATPRTWDMLGHALEGAKQGGSDVVYDVASGLVGEGTAVEFAAFVKLRGELPDPKFVLADPKKAIPNPPKDPDRLVALVTALAEYAAPISNEKTAQGKEIAGRFFVALAHVSEKAREYAGAGIMTFAAHSGNVSSLIQHAKAHKSDPAYSELLKHFKAALS